MTEIKIQSLEQIREAARHFIEAMGEHTVFAFYGKMGAGKNHFHQGGLRGVGSRGYGDLAHVCHCQ